MHRRFIALVIGTALAVTSIAAAPVKAQSRDETAATVAGVVALGIVGVALADDDKKDRRKDHVARNYGAPREYYAPKHHHDAGKYHNSRKYYRTGERRDHRGKLYNEWRYRGHNDDDRRNRFDDRGYRRGDGK